MKIKILKYVPKKETGMMINLKPNQVVAVDNEVAKKLVDSGYAEYEI